MDFSFTEEQELLRDNVRKLMQRHAPPETVRRHDREQSFPYGLYDAWVEAGLLALPFPPEVGGLGGDALDLAIVVEELARISPDFCMAYAGSVFCGLNILRKGSDEQRALWLPRLIKGEVKLAIGISEPDAGSDVGAMKCAARRHGDRWRINGQKLWTTGAGLKGSIISLYVRTAGGQTHYREGLSLFLVDNDAPGVVLNKLDMLGRRCVGTYEVFLNDVDVGPDRLVGGENRGWDCLMAGLQIERAVSAARSCGGALAVFELALSYAKERLQFGRPIGSFQAIGHMLADMQTEIEAARTHDMACRVACRLRQGSFARDHHGETHCGGNLRQGRRVPACRSWGHMG